MTKIARRIVTRIVRRIATRIARRIATRIVMTTGRMCGSRTRRGQRGRRKTPGDVTSPDVRGQSSRSHRCGTTTTYCRKLCKRSRFRLHNNWHCFGASSACDAQRMLLHAFQMSRTGGRRRLHGKVKHMFSTLYSS